MAENTYQAKLIKKLEIIFPGCQILKNDPNYQQGIPDLTILYLDKWAVLETKASAKSSGRPNQPYFIDKLSAMSFASFICPENEKDVLDDLQQAFQSSSPTRLS